MGYDQGALCGALLVGHAGEWQTYERVLQALLQRAGFSIGELDGVIGPKTLNALATALGVIPDAARSLVAAKNEAICAKLLTLPAK